MSYVVFARKYRPRTFNEVVGQEFIGTTLKNAIAQGRVGHAYLFSGMRGVGKTTMARVFAMALNCKKGTSAEPDTSCEICKSIHAGEDLDVIEIDGASNRGIDEVRNLRDGARLIPARSPFKIYVIDEVHMLTVHAFNALLKTLEEPPPHVKFILATTEPLKVPETIRSRCQFFEFKPLSDKQIRQQLQSICKQEKIKVEGAVLDLITRLADGSMRDALSILDKLCSFSSGKISAKQASDVLGVVLEEVIVALLDSIKNRDAAKALEIMDGVVSEGKTAESFFSQIINYLRDLMIFESCPEGACIDTFSDEKKKTLRVFAEHFSLESVLYMLSSLSNALMQIKRSSQPRILAEMQLIKLTRLDDIAPISGLISALENIELPGSRPPAGAAPSSQTAPAKGRRMKEEGPVASAFAPGVKLTAPLKTFMSRWPEVLAAIKKENVQAEAFLRNAQPVSLEKGLLVLAFPKQYNFQKEQLDSQRKKSIIEKSIREITGDRVKVRLKTVGEAEPSKGRSEAELKAPQAERKEGRLQDASESEPLIRKALKAFGGHLIK